MCCMSRSRGRFTKNRAVRGSLLSRVYISPTAPENKSQPPNLLSNKEGQVNQLTLDRSPTGLG